MGKVLRANNLAEALKIAEKLKTNENYNLFRGQGQDWKVRSTLGRLSPKEVEKAQKKIERLHFFFQSSPTLKKYISDIDCFFAIAQHYGIPTSYIDFTTSIQVAAYFATNSKSNIVGEDCSIICVSEKNLKNILEFSKSIFERDKVIPPYIVKIKVENLWRLQSQQGCFLFSPYSDFEWLYDFDKIVFPYSEQFNGITKDEIYPQRKCELEILLDHYFSTEKRILGQERMRRFAEETKTQIMTMSPVDFTKVIKQNSPHLSWSSSEFSKWEFPLKEEWVRSSSTLIKLQLSLKDSITTQLELMIDELFKYFEANRITRNQSLRFEIQSKPKLTKKLSKIISRSCTRIWDGTRNLPYSNKDIFAILSKYVCLEILEDKLHYTPSLFDEELILLEFTNKYGSITRCKAPQIKMEACFRDDLKNILIAPLTETISSKILLHINIPQILFEFDKLVQFFKEELVAYQVLHNSENENPVIFYTPSQLSVFGYA